MGKNILGKKGYLDYNAIIEDDVDMYMILGQRSDGKTYGVLCGAMRHPPTATADCNISGFCNSA